MAAPAEAAVSAENLKVAVLEELKRLTPKELECAICTHKFKAGGTAILPCAHTFCRQCLNTLVSGAGTPLACPTCASKHGNIKTAEDISKLPTNPFVETKLHVPIFCDVCKADGVDIPAAARCSICNKHLCEGDEFKHRRYPATSKHQLVPLPGPASPAVCGPHGKPLEGFCMSCSSLCCLLCLMDHHGNAYYHNAGSLVKQLPELRKSLQKTAAPAQERQVKLANRLVDTSAAIAEAEATSARLKADIKARFAALAALLNARIDELLAETEAGMAKVMESLTAEAAADKLRWLALQAPLSAAGHLLRANADPRHVGQLAPAVRACLDQLGRVPVPPSPLLPTIDFLLDEQVERTLREAGRVVFDVAYGPNCNASGQGLSKAFTNTATAFRVTAFTRSNVRRNMGGDIVAIRLCRSSANDDVAVATTITDKRDGTYEVTYRAPSTGDYTLHLTINGHPIQGSPFAVTAVVGELFFSFSGAPNFYDNKGVIYHLATAGGTTPWSNPHGAGIVAVTISNNIYCNNRDSVNAFVGNGVGSFSGRFESNAWIAIDLKGHSVRPTGYVLSLSSQSQCSFVLEASNDGASWRTLHTQEKDFALSDKLRTQYWTVASDDSMWGTFLNPAAPASSPRPGTWAHFRIRTTYNNGSSTSYYLTAFGFELYGELFSPA